MFGVAEIADAISDEFMNVLQEFDPGYLQSLMDDTRALRRMLPAGLSHGEAVDMIGTILSTHTPS